MCKVLEFMEINDICKGCCGPVARTDTGFYVRGGAHFINKVSNGPYLVHRNAR